MKIWSRTTLIKRGDNLSNNNQPTEEEIWALKDKNPRDEEAWPERLITWNPREFYLHTIHKSYQAKSGFEWLFLFLKDKSFSNHKKERVLRIMFRNAGRQVRLIKHSPTTFIVVSQPETKTGKAAHVHSVTMTVWGSIHCGCEWENSTANSETCTHCICVRTYFHFLEIDRVRQTPEIQREAEICACS